MQPLNTAKASLKNHYQSAPMSPPLDRSTKRRQLHHRRSFTITHVLMAPCSSQPRTCFRGQTDIAGFSCVGGFGDGDVWDPPRPHRGWDGDGYYYYDYKVYDCVRSALYVFVCTIPTCIFRLTLTPRCCPCCFPCHQNHGLRSGRRWQQQQQRQGCRSHHIVYMYIYAAFSKRSLPHGYKI